MLDKILGNRYKILSPLGTGGFGETYLAEDTQYPGTPKCVVKKLKPQLDNPSIWHDACRLFQREAETLSQLGQHDQIPQLLAHFEEDDHFFLVQELINGVDLSDELTPGTQKSEYYTTMLLTDILEVLEFVHQKGVIHRDIKPSNLIRRQNDGKIVLIDFGAVKSIGLQTTVTNSNTAHTVSICTPGYTPNEQYSGQPKLASDIYAIGMIGIQALTGKFPGELQKDASTGEVLWKEYAKVSPHLARVLDQMVLYDFRHRYQDATQAKAALVQLYNQPISVSTVSQSPPLAPTEPVTRVKDLAVPTSSHQSFPQTELKDSRPKRKLPIRTFFFASLLGFAGGTLGTVYAIQRFFPSMLKLAETPPAQEQPLTVGGVDELTPTQPVQGSNEEPAKISIDEDRSTTRDVTPVKPIEVDYSPLRSALSAGQWKSSDLITRDLILGITGRAGSFLRIEDIETIPCTEFNMIDQLWAQASQGRFGFSAQLQSWQGIVGKSNENTNVTQSNARNASIEFMKRALWADRFGRANEYRELIFSTNAPVGHLPSYMFIQDSAPTERTNLAEVSDLIPSLAQRATFCSGNPSTASS